MARRRNRRDEFPPAPEREGRNSHRNVLKVLRMVSEDDSATINGAIVDLINDNAIPRLKKPISRHPLFVLDPRLVRPDLNRGFKIGFESYRAKLEKAGRCNKDTVVAKIGDISIRRSERDGPERELFLPLMSDELTNERIGYYETLALNGVKGLQPKIEHPGALELYLGQLDIPKAVDVENPPEDGPTYERNEIIEAIMTSFTIHGIEKVTLGHSFVPGTHGEYPVE